MSSRLLLPGGTRVLASSGAPGIGSSGQQAAGTAVPLVSKAELLTIENRSGMPDLGGRRLRLEFS